MCVGGGIGIGDSDNKKGVGWGVLGITLVRKVFLGLWGGCMVRSKLGWDHSQEVVWGVYIVEGVVGFMGDREVVKVGWCCGGVTQMGGSGSVRWL